MQPDATNEKRMRLRYAGVCRLCGVDLPVRTEATYERSTKTVRCLECIPGEPTLPKLGPDGTGVPGASARREFERRKAGRAARVRAKHPRISGLILALSSDPQSTIAWDTGAVGEERLGRMLNELASDSLGLLHDRRVPGTGANIDHLAITATGIYVIDAKRYRGRPTLRVRGGLLRPRTETLRVGSRDCTKLVDGVLRQVDVVRGIVGETVPVTGVLCFIDADWPLIGGAFTTRDVEVLWPKRLRSLLADDGSPSPTVARLHDRLASALPPA